MKKETPAAWETPLVISEEDQRDCKRELVLLKGMRTVRATPLGATIVVMRPVLGADYLEAL